MARGLHLGFVSLSPRSLRSQWVKANVTLPGGVVSVQRLGGWVIRGGTTCESNETQKQANDLLFRVFFMWG